jgi:Tat protein secretion system quality control protein TatD with DNase activity
MAPAPFRGRTSHSGMIPLVARRVAEIKSVAIADVLRTTTQNAIAMYGLPLQVPTGPV